MIRRLLVITIVVMVVSASFIGPAFSQDKKEQPEAALIEAPSFSLKGLDGKTYSLNDYKGKSALVLSFWSIYCDSCVDEMLSLQKLEDKYKGKEVVILAINEDIKVPEERIRRFMNRLEKYRGRITYSILFDHDSTVFSSYKGTYLPALVIINKEGVITSHHRGFIPESELDIFASIDDLVGNQKPIPSAISPRTDTATVTGRGSICGFFDDTGWKKSFTGYESIEQEIEQAREVARRDAARLAVLEAIGRLGVKLYRNEPPRKCVDEYGIHVSRDPFDTKDPVSNLLRVIDYAEFFETISEQEMRIGNDYFVSRKVRIATDALSLELSSLGYIMEPLRIEFTYVNMSPLDQKFFITSLLNQSKFTGKLENPVFTPHSTSQVFDVFTSSQGFADEILEMDFGQLSVFVEDVTPTSLELEVWKGGR